MYSGFILPLHQRRVGLYCRVLCSGLCPLAMLPMNEPALSSTLLQIVMTYGSHCVDQRNSVAIVGGDQPKQIGGEMRDCGTKGSCLN